jgi:hypothetical protein
MSDDPDATWAEIKRKHAARKEHPYVADLIRILAPYPFGLRRQQVIHYMRCLRTPAELSVPRKFEAAVQSAFNRHCGESKTFTLGPEDDLFYWPRGKGEGTWAVHKDRGSGWLKARGLPDI